LTPLKVKKSLRKGTSFFEDQSILNSNYKENEKSDNPYPQFQGYRIYDVPYYDSCNKTSDIETSMLPDLKNKKPHRELQGCCFEDYYYLSLNAIVHAC
jgi:hypothetical protein